MNELSFRRARPDEFEQVASILVADPSVDEVTIAGSEDRARRWGRAQLRLRGLGHMHVGEMNGEIVVVVEIGPARRERGIVPRLHNARAEVTRAIAWARVFGIATLPRYVRIRRAEYRVFPSAPEDAYHFSEMTTAAKYRYSGIGAYARVYGEKEARRLGYKRMSLHTSVVNPTKDMVMRHGYALVATGTDAGYERLSGIAGWHLLVKELKERPTAAATEPGDPPPLEDVPPGVSPA